MKYLVYCRPPTEIVETLERYARSITPKVTALPSIGYHCTLFHTCGVDDDDKIIGQLNKIKSKPLTVTLGDVDMFCSNSFVVRIENTSAFQKIHYDVAEIGRDYVDWKTVSMPELSDVDGTKRAMFKIYGGPFNGLHWSPHITIAKLNGDGFNLQDAPDNPLKGLEWKIDKFYLSRKNGEWRNLKEFSLTS